MPLHESAEMYLETIYTLTQKCVSVRSVDVAEEMGFSKPSVSRAVGLLKRNGYLLMAEDGTLTLTESGRLAAEKIFERHTVLTRFLTTLGVSEDVAEDDACKIEHDISDDTVNAIKAWLETAK